MSENLVDLIRRGYDAWNSGEREWVLEHMTDDIAWVPPPSDPDAQVYRGYEGVQEFWNQWRSAVGQLSFAPKRFIEAGEEVIVIAERSGKGTMSNIEVTDEVIQVFSFNDENRCYRVREFYDLDMALDATYEAGRRSAD